MSEDIKKARKSMVGVVVSDKMDKTVVVSVSRRAPHSVFKKVVTRSKKYYAHDGDNSSKVGDKVKIIETRPMSKLKRWRVGEVLERSIG